jgi:hypothetical protein
MRSNIGGNNQRTNPDVYWVELSFHPDMWANGEAPDVYKFRCIGGTWGLHKWAVHAVYCNRPMPQVKNLSLPRLRSMISRSLEEQTHREITSWATDCLAWEEGR